MKLVTCGQLNGTNRPLIALWITFFVFLNSVQSDTVPDISPGDLQILVNQILHPIPEYELHAMGLRNQLLRLLENNRYRKEQYIQESNLTDDEKDRLLNVLDALEKNYLRNFLKSDNPKRSLATLAKNGQLPTQEPEDSDSQTDWIDKRNLAALARSGDYLGNGKRNVGSLARDFQLPSANGKRASASGIMRYMPPFYFKKNLVPNKVLFFTAPYTVKRNLGALKASLVHGNQQKKNIYELPFQNEYENLNELYPNDDGFETVFDGVNSDSTIQNDKRYLGRIMPPTRATSTTHRGRL